MRRGLLFLTKLVIASGFVGFIVFQIHVTDHLSFISSDGSYLLTLDGQLEPHGSYVLFQLQNGLSIRLPSERIEGLLTDEASKFVFQAADGMPVIIPAPGVSHVEPTEGQLVVERGLISLVKQARLWPLALALGLFAGGIVIGSYRWHWLVRPLEFPLSFPRAWQLTYIGSFCNTFIPGMTGGDIVKAWLIARGSDRKTEAVLTVIVDRIVGLVGLILLGSVAVLMGIRTYSFAILTMCSLLLVVACTATVFYSQRVRTWLRIDKLWRRFPVHRTRGDLETALRLYRRERRVVVLSLGLALLGHAVLIGIFALCAASLEVTHVPITAYFITVPLINIMAAIPMTPQGIGIAEMGAMYYLGLAGLGQTEAVAITLLYRTVALCSNVPGGVLMFWERAPFMSQHTLNDAAATKGPPTRPSYGK